MPLKTMALNIKYENKSNYYVSINNTIYKLNKIKDIDTNEYFFNMYFDNYIEFNNYIKSTKFNNEIKEELFNNINNAIYYGYIKKDKSDIFYYITQILIYKYYYGFENVYMCSSTGNKLAVYEDIMLNIHNNYYLNELIDLNINVMEDLNLDNNYKYDLSNFNNKLVGSYKINYYIEENYLYYYNNYNMYFNENNNILLEGNFNVNVEKTGIENENVEQITIKKEEDNGIILDKTKEQIKDTSKQEITNIENPKTFDNIHLMLSLIAIIPLILLVFVPKITKN